MHNHTIFAVVSQVCVAYNITRSTRLLGNLAWKSVGKTKLRTGNSVRCSFTYMQEHASLNKTQQEEVLTQLYI